MELWSSWPGSISNWISRPGRGPISQNTDILCFFWFLCKFLMVFVSFSSVFFVFFCFLKVFLVFHRNLVFRLGNSMIFIKKYAFPYLFCCFSMKKHVSLKVFLVFHAFSLKNQTKHKKSKYFFEKHCFA